MNHAALIARNLRLALRTLLKGKIYLFHGDKRIIGRQITLNNQGYTVIGVMARDVDFP